MSRLLSIMSVVFMFLLCANLADAKDKPNILVIMGEYQCLQPRIDGI